MNAKASKISQKLIEEFCNYLSKNMGFSFSKERLTGIEMKISAIVHAFGRDNEAEKCLIEIMESPIHAGLISKLAEFLTVGETYFFRDTSFFTILENQILPELIKKNQNSRTIRIWSAACASGEEPYSIAILLHRLIPRLDTWNVRIWASDINSKFLQRAEKGIYKKWSFRTTSPKIQELYFEKLRHDQLILKSSIRNMVKFFYVNLVDTIYQKPFNEIESFDLIICNNVLIYFTSEKISQTVNRLTTLLIEGGWLCVTAIEVPYIQNPHLIPCRFGNTILFKKGQGPKTDFLKTSSFESELILKPERLINKSEAFDIFKPVSTEIFKNKKENCTCDATPKVQDEQSSDHYGEIEGLFKARQYALAIEKIEQLLEQCHEDLCLLKKYLPHIILLISAYANQKKLEDAYQWCQKYLKINALDPHLYRLQATILQELKRFNEAVESLRSALYLDSDLVIAHFELGCLLIQQKRINDAERSFRNALKLLEDYPLDACLPGTEGILAGNLKNIILGKNIN